MRADWVKRTRSAAGFINNCFCFSPVSSPPDQVCGWGPVFNVWFMIYVICTVHVMYMSPASVDAVKPRHFLLKLIVLSTPPSLPFFFFLPSGKHADGWFVLFISPSRINPITAQLIFLLSENSWHFSVQSLTYLGLWFRFRHEVTIAGPWPNTSHCKMHV